MNIDFIKVPFSNNPSMQKYDGPIFNPHPDEKYLSEKQLQLKKYGKEHKYIIKGDEGHGFRTETARLELFEDYEKFLAEYLN